MGTGVSWGPSELMNDLAAVYGVDLPYRLPRLQAVQSGDGEGMDLRASTSKSTLLTQGCRFASLQTTSLGSLLSPTSSRRRVQV